MHRHSATILIPFLAIAFLFGAVAAPALAYPATTAGGEVQLEPHVYAIFWGSNWNGNEEAVAEREKVESLYENLSESGWQGILTQYWSPQEPEEPADGTEFPTVSPSVGYSFYVDTEHGAAPSGVTIEAIEAEVNEAIAANKGAGWPQSPTVNDQFAVLVPPGTTYSLEEQCGFHSSTSTDRVYTFIFWLHPSCATDLSASHEYAEAVVDPYATKSKSAAWSEIADLCELAQERGTVGEAEVVKLQDNYQSECSLSDSNPTPTPPAFTSSASDITATEAILHATAEFNGLQTSTWVFKWGTSEKYNHETSGGNTGDLEAFGGKKTLSGLSPETTYHYRLSILTDNNERVTGPDETFATLSERPIVTTEGQSGLKPHKTNLHGKVNPNGYATHYHFEWGDQEESETEEFSHVVPAEDIGVGSGEADVSVEQPIEGLKGAETTYYYRLVAESSKGRTAGTIKHFTTPRWTPSTSLGVFDVGQEYATLGATIDPEGFATTYRFEWGASEEYGNSIPVPDASVGSGDEGVEVSQTIEGLEPETTYYYRLIAENENGQSVSAHAGSLHTRSHTGFVADEFPAAVGGASGALHLESSLFSLECEAPALDGEIEDPSPSLGARGFEGQSCNSGEMDMGDCELLFYPGEVSEGAAEGIAEVGPANCGPISVAYKYLGYSCPIEIAPQWIAPVSFTNEGEGTEATVAIEMSDAGMQYALGGACGGFAFEDLSWEGSWDASATPVGAEEPVGLRITQITPRAITEPATGVVGGESPGATLNGTILPAPEVEDDFYYFFEYGTSKEYGSATAPGPVEGQESLPVSEAVEGLSPETTYHYRLVVGDEEAEEIVSRGSDETFATPSERPVVTTEGYSDLKAGKATLHGKVNPNGHATHYHFEWGDQKEFEDEEFNHAVPAEDVDIGSGTSDVSVEQQVAGLKGGEATYHYRLVAESAKGKSAGEANSFTTPAWVPGTSVEVLAIGSEEATLGATIDPEGFATTYRFEWGASEEYGNSIPVPDASVGSGDGGVEVSQTIEGLEPETTYYYRLIAENENGQGPTHAGSLLSGSTGPILEPPEGGFPAPFSLGGEEEVVLRRADGTFGVECKTEGGTQALGGEGHFADSSSGTLTLVLHNCVDNVYKSACATPGQKAGTLEAEGLPFRLVYLSDGKPGVLLLPNAESELLINARCLAGLLIMEIGGGGVLGRITEPALGEASPTLTLDFESPEVGGGEYAQQYTQTAGEAEYGLWMATNGESLLATLEAEAAASFSEGEGELVEG